MSSLLEGVVDRYGGRSQSGFYNTGRHTSKFRNARFISFPVVVCLSVLFCLLAVQAQYRESVEAIMEKVAQNQDRAQEMRSAFVYRQTLLLRFKRGDGKTCREELRDFTVAPSANGTHKTLNGFLGKYLKGKELIEYNEPGYHYKGLDLDSELMTSFADDLANDEGSRDGIAPDLFPLTSQEQKKYVYTLKGKEAYRGKDVYRISFKPNRKDLYDGPAWAGEVLVDAHEYQPALVTTRYAQGIPFWVKTLLGTNVKHLGFKVEYERFDKDLWFPVSYGGEFQVKAVFFYERTMAIALRNSGFQRAEVSTSLSFEEPFATGEAPSNPELSPPPETSIP
jgi:hypothetical protein